MRMSTNTVRAMLAAAVVCAVVSAPVAYANPDSPADQDKFYSSVGSQGVSGPHDQQLAMGKQVCLLNRLGRDPGEIESYLHNQYAITTHIAEVIRVAAELHLC